MHKSAKTMVPYRLAFLLFIATVVAGVMDTEYSWDYLDYTFASNQQRESAIRSGKFIPENCVIIDVDVFQGTSEDRLYFNSGGPSNPFPIKRVFVTIPRIKSGNPASLAEVTGESNSALLAPFPNWKYHQFSEERPPHCENSIISVFRMKIDELGRLWVVDSGRINQFASDARSICPPKLMIFDLKNNDKLIKLYTFPSNQYRPESLFTNIVVDIGDIKGRSTYAYITDTTVYKLIVYDYKNDQSWVVDQAYMYPYPNKGQFNVNGVSFPLMDGVLGLALGPVIKNNRKMYFHAFASVRESWVFTSTLQNRSLYENGLVDGSGIFFTSAEVRPVQSSVQAMTSDGILFSAMMDNSLTCWNAENPFLPSNINVVYKNDKEFQFPTGLKVIGDKIWAVTGQLQNHFGTLVRDRSIKYRILVGYVDELIRGSVCDKRLAPYDSKHSVQRPKPTLVFSSKG